VKLLLDHCVHCRLARELTRHDVKTTAELGWAALKNGQLLAEAAAAGFDAFITVDKSFRHQQNLDALPISVVQLEVADTRLPSLLTVVPKIEESLGYVARFRFV
jgi:predicted nuclease of predicted toxin-antitoxin system